MYPMFHYQFFKKQTTRNKGKTMRHILMLFLALGCVSCAPTYKPRTYEAFNFDMLDKRFEFMNNFAISAYNKDDLQKEVDRVYHRANAMPNEIKIIDMDIFYEGENPAPFYNRYGQHCITHKCHAPYTAIFIVQLHNEKNLYDLCKKDDNAPTSQIPLSSN